MFGYKRAAGKVQQTPRKRAPKRLTSHLISLTLQTLLAFTLVTGPTIATAQTVSPVPPLVIRSDRGGLMKTRLEQIVKLRRSGQQVKITGRFCYSTCTMLIGLPQTCVSPTTIFGFHGPSRRGRPLSADRFDHASKLMAQDYPPALKAWFMKTARFEIKDLYKIRGTELIAMGVRAC